jgi:hypothetical protein
MAEPTLRGEHGAVLVSRARIATRRAGRYADLLAQRLSRQAHVEALPGGYRLSFSGGEGLLDCAPEALSLMVSTADAPSLADVRDALGTCLERLGRQDRLRVRWR